MTGLALDATPAFGTEPYGCAYLYPDAAMGGSLALSVAIATDANLYDSESEPGFLVNESFGAGMFSTAVYFSSDRTVAYELVDNAPTVMPTRVIDGRTCYVYDSAGYMACNLDRDFLIMQTQIPRNDVNDAMMTSAIQRFTTR